MGFKEPGKPCGRFMNGDLTEPKISGIIFGRKISIMNMKLGNTMHYQRQVLV